MLHQVGVGALGPVFRTYEPTRDRLVAVKVFRLDITPEQAQALADELSVAAQAGLFHPSIVEPIASGIEGSVAYRAEEYVAAESLDVAMRHYAPAAMDKVLPFISQLAAAVDFARMARVGHGALHPRDIFVTPEEARATGFGVVEALERVGLRAPVRRPYSAPERVAGEKWGTPADVFSLGAIAYELLTGRRPAGIGKAIGDLSGASLGDHTASVHAILVRAMEEDPAARFSTAMAFASALESASRGLPVPAVVAAIPPVASGVSRKTDAPPGPPDLDDIAPERDDDEAHFALELEKEETEAQDAAAADRDLFDMEAIEDLALDPPLDRFTDDFNPEVLDEPKPPERFAAAFEPSVTPEPETPPGLQPKFEPGIEREIEPEPAYAGYTVPPRRSIDYVPEEPAEVRPHRRTLPAVVMLIFGLLIGFGAGFGAGYGVGTRRAITQETKTATSDSSASEPAAEAKPGAGKAYSEEAVSPPTAKPAEPAPPVSAEPPAAAPSKPAPPPGDAGNGRLIVRSVPSNAGVTIDGTWRGRTPLTVEKLRLGNHEVRVVQPGYNVGRETATLTSAAPARTLSFRLQKAGAAAAAPAPSRERTAPSPERPAPSPERTAPAAGRSGPPPSRGPGSLYVDSRPRGAAVFVDGKQVGVTPTVVSNIAAGAHTVRLELADHRTWTATSQVIAGQQTRVTGSLERIR